MVFAAPPLFTCKPIVIRGHMFTLFEWEQNQNLEILEKNNYTKHGFLFIKHILFKNTLIISAFSASTNFSPFTHINAYSFLFTLHYTLTLYLPFQLPVLSIMTQPSRYSNNYFPLLNQCRLFKQLLPTSHVIQTVTSHFSINAMLYPKNYIYTHFEFNV